MSLQDKLDAFRHEFETKRAPAGVADTMKKATAALIATGQAERAVKTGDRAPAFTLPDADGRSVSSVELLASGPLVVTFYRGVWCPYCNMELQAIEETVGDIRLRGAAVVAISPQSAANSRKSIRDNKLSFPVLEDHGGKIADAFGLRFHLPEDLIALYKGFGNDLAVVNGEPSWTLPMPARYVIAPDGIVAYGEVNPDYTRRPDPSELLPVLDRLAKSSAA